MLISNASGTLIRLHANGDVEITGAGKLIANTAGDVSITTQGNAAITASGSATVACGSATVACSDIRLGGSGASQYVKLANGTNSTTTKAL